MKKNKDIGYVLNDRINFQYMLKETQPTLFKELRSNPKNIQVGKELFKIMKFVRLINF